MLRLVQKLVIRDQSLYQPAAEPNPRRQSRAERGSRNAELTVRFGLVPRVCLSTIDRLLQTVMNVRRAIIWLPRLIGVTLRAVVEFISG